MTNDYFPDSREILAHSKCAEIIEELKRVPRDHVVSVRFAECDGRDEAWFQQVAPLSIEDWQKGDYIWGYAHPEDLLKELI